MKYRFMTITLLSLATLASCKGDKKESHEVIEVVEVEEVEVIPEMQKLTLKLEPKSDSKASGSVVFKEEDGVVKFTAVIGGLDEGMHAIHIHDKADCSSADGKSTGGHWNPTNEQHGKWGAAEGYHKGDIGNFPADENGNGTITMSTDQWCIGCGDPKKDVVGKAIIVHQGTDDFTSQPSGAAGARISCGGIIK
ncbi:superoxide dismutase family protein [Dokdonia donghaensis]|uniref:Superoxide dismutase n=1 Tax=Dokdonia donghaensis DSW-1 TaxID=1300343 RepID=A0A0A2GTN2_9FLAO|nr:superoxide dismutase family protein [Dokdonia donghaensis]ANH60910.1 Superoxide dismutase [Cu-Zn] precursor [Dokdonia donghaensis DSW-1]KGO05843.1 superoxide dismutase [Dokdonia donghaensis DSW-1]